MGAKYYGMTDRRAEKDEFGIDKYITGLSSFITNCNTPITIAIQGDWGTGKTSIMEMVKNKIKEKYHATDDADAGMIWFNTWQFSQFNMGDDLPITLLTCLVEALQISGENQEEFRKYLSVLGAFMKKAAYIITENVAGSEIAQLGKAVADSNTKTLSLPEAVSGLRESFQQCIIDRIKASNGKLNRIIIFIDDLDRLNPGKAVELLEVLKLFLDCDDCVFVLAIDYEVVSRGVEEKYGADFDKKKGRSFFDKIIQVPFKMPVAQYDIESFVKERFKELNISCKDEDLQAYINLIQCSVERNPRGMKRLLNAFLLLRNIMEVSGAQEKVDDKLLFATLCLQQSVEPLYSYLVCNADDLTSEKLYSFAGQNVEGEENGDPSDEQENRREAQLVTLYESIGVKDEDVRDEAISFMDVFTKLIDSDGNKAISDKEMEQLKKALKNSAITASTTTRTNAKSEKWGVRNLLDYESENQKPYVPALTKLFDEMGKELPGIEFVAMRRFTKQNKIRIKYNNKMLAEADLFLKFATISFYGNKDNWYECEELENISWAKKKDLREVSFQLSSEDDCAAAFCIAKTCYETYSR